MLTSPIFLALQSAGTWSVQVGPWTLPPAAWVPLTAIIGGVALRIRARQLRGPGGSAGPDRPEA